MLTHDVAAFAGGLSAKLATRSRHVCTFFGAGTSKACGLPDVAALTSTIRASLEGEQLAAFERIASTRNLEQALSRLRRIQAVVDDGDRVSGLSGEEARALDVDVCRLIIRELTTADTRLDAVNKLASWVARADYARPVELFTVNYDVLIETALEGLAVPYFDGFVGFAQGRFRTDLVEASHEETDAMIPRFFARIWKLHGSVNWARDQSDAAGDVVRLGRPVPNDQIAAIFPSDAKYEESRRMPFVVLQDRLRRALHEPETLFLIAGYSWGDDHLNELFFEAAARRPRSEYIAFCYSEIPQNLADRALRTPNLQVITQGEAIIGGLRGQWQAPSSSVTLPTDIWDGARCQLGDFERLASFLARSSSAGSHRHEGSMMVGVNVD